MKKTLVIDAHCHIYPDKIAARACAGTDRFYGTEAACDGTTTGLLKKMDEGGIRLALVHSVATTPHQVRSINDFIAASVQENPTRLFGFGTLHPESEDLFGDVRHLVEKGLRGIKLHPDIQQFPLDDPRCMKLYEYCEREEIFLLIHTGDSRYDFSNPDRLLPVLRDFPRLRIIGAHLAGWSVWEEALEKLHSYENLYVDCSSTFPFVDVAQAREWICRWGAHRVLFGSDYPMWDPVRELETLRGLALPPEEEEMILSGNARRLFQLS